MKTLLQLFSLAMICSTQAQSLSPVVIAASGGYSTAGGFSLSWTLGETATETFSNGGYILIQGFQQPAEGVVIGINLDLLVFLEGPFSISEMGTSVNSAGLIPLLQPFNTPPWNYTGTESISSIPNPDIVDWVLVELRDTSEAALALPGTVIARKAGFLLKNGAIVGVDGASNMTFTESFSQNLFAVVIHRNHLSVMSSEPLTEAGGVYSWDFTDELSKAYLDGQKQIGSFIFGMIGGDTDGNGTVETQDIDMVWKPDAGNQDYLVSDLNLNSQVSNQDKNDIGLPNSGAMSMVPTSAGFTCGSPFTDTRDGQSYNTVQIGTQCWMAENMNVGTWINISVNQTNNSIIEKYCNNNLESNCNIYGGLYQWNEAMQYSTTPGATGICPTGWHLPTDDEWTTLTDYVDNQPSYQCNSTSGWIAKAMAATTLWNNSTATCAVGNNLSLNNATGFSGLPGGWSGGGVGGTGYWWSSTVPSTIYVWNRRLHSNYPNVNRDISNKAGGLSVRCVKE